MRRNPAARGRRDANHAQIQAVYEIAGCDVLDLSRLGDDCADTLVQDKHGRKWFREIKTDTGVLSGGQAAFLDRWGGRVIRTVDEALDDIRALSKG